MKGLKIFSILVVAALLLAPATAMARSHFNFSLNLFDCVRPVLIPPPRPIVIAPAPPAYYFYPACPRPHCPPRTIVKEYHYYHQAPEQPVEDITPHNPYYPPHHPHR